MGYHHILPAEFQPFRPVGDGKWHTSGVLTKSSYVHPDHPDVPDWLVRHCVQGIDMGTDDNTITTVKWTTKTLPDVLGQVGPVIGLAGPSEVASSDPLRLGWGPVCDIGLGGPWYYLSVFTAPPAELLGTITPLDAKGAGIGDMFRYKVDLPAQGEQKNLSEEILGKDTQEVSIICKDGHVCVTWNNHLLSKGYRRPEWTKGRTFFGVRCIDIKPMPGQPSIDLESLTWSGEPYYLDEPTPTEVEFKVETI